MKIGIDISQIVYETGVSVYTRELVSALVKKYPDHEFVLYGGSLRRSRELKNFLLGSKNVTKKLSKLAPSFANLIWNRLHVLPIEQMIGKVDVFHTSDWAEAPASCPKVTTIHDLSIFKYPALTHPKILATHTRRMAWVKKESDCVIVPSTATKDEALKLGIYEDKIVVIPEAVSGIFTPKSKSEIGKVMSKYKISTPYALAVGANPRKNIDRIIKAFYKSKANSKLKQLVVVGRGPAIEDLGVNFLGHVPADDLPALYSGAGLLVYVSINEGFGLPILEAFACGCPVLTSNVSSMPEVAGKAAVLVDPMSVEEISKGFVKTVNNREKLVDLGLRRVKKYNWDMVASETMKAYESVVASK